MIGRKYLQISLIVFLICTFLLYLPSVAAQDILIEWLIEQNGEFSDQSSALDYLEDLEKYKVHPNTATVDDLLRIPGISIDQAEKILAYRDRNGNFTSLDLVRIAGGIAEDWFNLIKRYLAFSVSGIGLRIDIRQRNLQRIEESKGYRNGSFRGSRLKNYTRIQTYFGNTISVGVLFEKDAGEKDLSDHGVGYVRYQSVNRSLTLIAGNYSLVFGQGLLFARRSYFGKGQDPVSPVRRHEQGGKEYRSSSESEAFSGLYAAHRSRFFSLSVFGSKIDRDARTDKKGKITSFVRSGYHRTHNEISNKNILNEKLLGLRLRLFPDASVNIGFTGASINYSPLLSGITVNRESETSPGNDVRVIGLDFSIVLNRIEVFGEAGFTDPGSYGYIWGLRWSEQNTKIGLLYRNFASDFYSPFGSAFADNPLEVRNESGLYVGFMHRFTPLINIALYVDLFNHPSKTGTLPVPENGSEYFVQILSPVSSNMRIYLNWRRKKGISRVKKEDSNGIVRYLFEEKTNDRFRIQGNFQLTSRLSASSRIEIQNSILNDEPGNSLGSFFDDPGMQLTAKLTYVHSPAFKLSTQASLFSSRGNRMYQYEPDLPGLLRVTQLSGRGERLSTVITSNWGPGRLSLKYAIVHLPDRTTIGSGASSIAQNYMQDVGIQWDIRY